MGCIFFIFNHNALVNNMINKAIFFLFNKLLNYGKQKHRVFVVSGIDILKIVRRLLILINLKLIWFLNLGSY